eukprot:5864596-Ditylum_brightwellii.AAC.1
MTNQEGKTTKESNTGGETQDRENTMRKKHKRQKEKQKEQDIRSWLLKWVKNIIKKDNSQKQSRKQDTTGPNISKETTQDRKIKLQKSVTDFYNVKKSGTKPNIIPVV